MKENRKSRRRFLAEALFAGGGLTAAAFLAKAGLSDPEPEPSQTAGVVCIPEELEATPEPSGTPEPECSPMQDETPTPYHGPDRVPKAPPRHGDRDPFRDLQEPALGGYVAVPLQK